MFYCRLFSHGKLALTKSSASVGLYPQVPTWALAVEPTETLSPAPCRIPPMGLMDC